jgi:hypothetical protein
MVDRYLHKPDLPLAEATAFLKSFPLRSATTGYRLYAPTPQPYHYEEIVAGDRAALERVNEWVADSALEKFRPELLVLQQRLATWVDQAR